MCWISSEIMKRPVGCGFLLTDGATSAESPYDPADRSNFPDDCLIDFDMKLIDLFQEMDKKQMKLRDRIHSEFYSIKELLGHTPSRIGVVHLYG